jgi:hypothetical protein
LPAKLGAIFGGRGVCPERMDGPGRTTRPRGCPLAKGLASLAIPAELGALPSRRDGRRPLADSMQCKHATHPLHPFRAGFVHTMHTMHRMHTMHHYAPHLSLAPKPLPLKLFLKARSKPVLRRPEGPRLLRTRGPGALPCLHSIHHQDDHLGQDSFLRSIARLGLHQGFYSSSNGEPSPSARGLGVSRNGVAVSRGGCSLWERPQRANSPGQISDVPHYMALKLLRATW